VGIGTTKNPERATSKGLPYVKGRVFGGGDKEHPIPKRSPRGKKLAKQKAQDSSLAPQKTERKEKTGLQILALGEKSRERGGTGKGGGGVTVCTENSHKRFARARKKRTKKHRGKAGLAKARKVKGGMKFKNSRYKWQ